jgi:hypothetical protein
LNSQIKQNMKGHHMRDALPPLPEKTIKQFTDHKDLGFIQVGAEIYCTIGATQFFAAFGTPSTTLLLCPQLLSSRPLTLALLHNRAAGTHLQVGDFHLQHGVYTARGAHDLRQGLSGHHGPGTARVSRRVVCSNFPLLLRSCEFFECLSKVWHSNSRNQHHKLRVIRS